MLRERKGMRMEHAKIGAVRMTNWRSLGRLAAVTHERENISRIESSSNGDGESESEKDSGCLPASNDLVKLTTILCASVE